MVSISRATGGRPIRVLGTVAPSTTGTHRRRFKQNLMPRRAIPCFWTHCLPHRAQSSLPDAKTVDFDLCPTRQGCGEVFGRPLRCGMVLLHGAFRVAGGKVASSAPSHLVCLAPAVAARRLLEPWRSSVLGGFVSASPKSDRTPARNYRGAHQRGWRRGSAAHFDPFCIGRGRATAWRTAVPERNSTTLENGSGLWRVPLANPTPRGAIHRAGPVVPS